MPSTGSAPTRRIRRQHLSCTNCRARKVKCDRVQPCRTCVARGKANECVFIVYSDADERRQAHEIRALRSEVRKLRGMIASNVIRPDRRKEALETIVNTIRTAPEDQVTTLVQLLRANQSLEDMAASIQHVPPGLIAPENRKVLETSLQRVIEEEQRQKEKRPAPDDGQPEGSELSRDESDEVAVATAQEVRRRSLLGAASASTSGPPGERVFPDEEEEFEEDEEDEVRRGSRTSDTSLARTDRNPTAIQRRTSLVRPPPQSHLPNYEVFLERFVDDFAPPAHLVRGEAGKADAIRAAAGVRMFSPMLSNAFEAVSTVYFGQGVNDGRLVSSGHKVYVGVLKELQEALLDPERSRSVGTLLTVVILMAYESIQSTSDKALMNHLLGALRLIEYRGPASHVTGIEHLTFVELRPYWAAVFLVCRTPSFLARPEWKTVPWAAGLTQKDIMHYLLDEVVELPGLLNTFDYFVAAARSGAIPPNELLARRTALWSQAIDLERRFLAWKAAHADTYPPGQPFEIPQDPADPSNRLPPFRCMDPRTGTIITPPLLAYPDPQLARTLCTYYAATLLLLPLVALPGPHALTQDPVDLARRICRSLEMYLRTTVGNMITRMMMPMRVAYQALPAEGPERAWVGEVIQRVERSKQLRSWAVLVKDGDVRP